MEQQGKMGKYPGAFTKQVTHSLNVQYYHNEKRFETTLLWQRKNIVCINYRHP